LGRSVHYIAKFETAGGSSPIYHSYRYPNTQLSVNDIDPMIEGLNENSSVPSPGWLRRFVGHLDIGMTLSRKNIQQPAEWDCPVP
jgi:hypothetical protein